LDETAKTVIDIIENAQGVGKRGANLSGPGAVSSV